MHDTAQLTTLKDFFGKIWDTNAIDQRAIDEIRERGPCRILDVGCGNNLYKKFFPDLFGIDIINPNAEQVCDILEFEPEDTFDIVLCFGSLNFGGRSDILARLHKIRQCLAGNGLIFMKVNPGIRWQACPDLVIYPWTILDIHALADETGLTVRDTIRSEETANGLRYKFTYCCR